LDLHFQCLEVRLAVMSGGHGSQQARMGSENVLAPTLTVIRHDHQTAWGLYLDMAKIYKARARTLIHFFSLLIKLSMKQTKYSLDDSCDIRSS